jgi:hypothetical protein
VTAVPDKLVADAATREQEERECEAIRLTLYREGGAFTPVELNPVRLAPIICFSDRGDFGRLARNPSRRASRLTALRFAVHGARATCPPEAKMRHMAQSG